MALLFPTQRFSSCQLIRQCQIEWKRLDSLYFEGAKYLLSSKSVSMFSAMSSLVVLGLFAMCSYHIVPQYINRIVSGLWHWIIFRGIESQGSMKRQRMPYTIRRTRNVLGRSIKIVATAFVLCGAQDLSIYCRGDQTALVVTYVSMKSVRIYWCRSFA